MKPEQKIVAVGAATGVAAMALSVWLLTKALPTPAIADTFGERLAYALRANILAVVPLFISGVALVTR